MTHSVCPEHLEPLVVALVGEPGEVNGGDGLGGEGHRDLDIVMVIDRRNLGYKTRYAGVDLGHLIEKCNM